MQSLAPGGQLLYIARLLSLPAVLQLLIIFIQLSANLIPGVALDTIERAQVWPPGEEPCGLAEASSRERIINGHEARSGDFPSFVRLILVDSREPRNESSCGGTIIGKQHILTAAHCLRGKFLAAVVHPYLRFPEQAQLTATLCSSRRYKASDTGEDPYDIGVIRLNVPLKYKMYSRWSACLPTGPLNRSTLASVVGFGLYKQSPDKVPTMPLTITMKPFECFERFKHYSRLCMRPDSEETSPCYGDSGGPLLAKENGRWTVFGVVSHGFYAGICKSGAAFADVYRLRYDILELKEDCNRFYRP